MNFNKSTRYDESKVVKFFSKSRGLVTHNKFFNKDRLFISYDDNNNKQHGLYHYRVDGVNVHKGTTKLPKNSIRISIWSKDTNEIVLLRKIGEVWYTEELDNGLLKHFNKNGLL